MKLFPLRTIRTQYGAVLPVLSLDTQLPPVLARYWALAPLPGVITISANVELALSVSRTMTPAFAQGSVFPTAVTRAWISQSPPAI